MIKRSGYISITFVMLLALCMLLGVSAAMAEKLTVTAWDANFNGNALQAAADDYNDKLRKKERAAARWMEHEATRHERFADLSRQIGDAV